MSDPKTVTMHGRCLLDYMRKQGKLQYGAVLDEQEVHAVLEIQYPETGDRNTFTRLDLLVLGATDYVRNVLLGEGMAFVSHKRDYRILLPSENAKHIERYISAADGKLGRALKLSRNMPSPVTPTGDTSFDENRIIMKRAAVKRESNRAKNIK